jgi:hypothetical protein
MDVNAMLTHEVLSYLIEHPEAQDTVEGLAEWRLLDQRIRQSVSEVTAVLNDLLKRDLVVARHGADGRIHYRVNLERQDEIRRLLGRRE